MPPDLIRDRVGVVAMDMDSTLITIECIDEIADLAGIKPAVAAITAAAMRGDLDFRGSLEQRVALLAGLPEELLLRVYDERLKLSPGAQRMIDGFKAVGAKILLASGGFTFFTERLRARLGIDETIANTIEVDGGKLTGLRDRPSTRVKGERFSWLLRPMRGAGRIAVAIAMAPTPADAPRRRRLDRLSCKAARARAAPAADQPLRPTRFSTCSPESWEAPDERAAARLQLVPLS